MSAIELRHLATMAAIAEEGSFGRAATRLGYTQSTISQHVAALEKAVGGPVFDRPGGPRPVRITPLGAVVLEHGRDLLAGADALTGAVERFRAGDGRIDIGTFQSVSNVMVPTVVRRLREEHPDCDIRMTEEVPGQQPRIDDLDLLFYDGRLDGDVDHVKLLDDPYVLVARPGDFPAGPVRVGQLDGAPLVAYPPVCDQPRLELALARGGARPRIVFRSAGDDTILSMVRAGMGSAVLPWLAVHGSGVRFDDRLSVHELRPALAPREVFLLWQAGRSHSPLAARTIEIAVEAAADLVQQASHR
ncbi:LysR family transcriptional regulator [Actinoplanes auranticolor]|uniref:Transcriptional regulator n=1 Tax=Actinoplanes auranticolor TaxID=47988 RepID=A0A919S5M6_9ACTN|nr:LysR family transcriptional regulator [Actinoplanes auranticolor]GIM65662.1 transcriptional regulator [Actinoplanes auranticolor]